MLKKILTCLVCGLIISFVGVVAMAETSLAIDEALSCLSELNDEAVEVQADILADYHPINQNKEIYSGIHEIKVIVLRYDAPDPETGKNRKAWLLCDKMKKLPEEYRAASLEEATLLIIVENQYRKAGVICDFTDQESEDKKFRSITKVEELTEYLETAEVKNDVCHDRYNTDAYVNIYNAKTGVCQTWAFTSFDTPVFVRNAEALTVWKKLLLLEKFQDEVAQHKETGQAVAVLSAIEKEKFIPSAVLKLWQEYLEKGEDDLALADAENLYWATAETLSKIDDNNDHRRMYDIVISTRSKTLLNQLVKMFRYEGVEDRFSGRKAMYYSGEYPPKRNPVAVKIHETLCELDMMKERIDMDLQKDESGISGTIEEGVKKGIITRNTCELWKAYAADKKYEFLQELIDDYYWEKVEAIIPTEKNTSRQRQLEEAIKTRSRERLYYLMNYYGYHKDQTSYQRIIDNRLYIAQVDPEWYEDQLDRLMEILSVKPESDE